MHRNWNSWWGRVFKRKNRKWIGNDWSNLKITVYRVDSCMQSGHLPLYYYLSKEERIKNRRCSLNGTTVLSELYWYFFGYDIENLGFQWSIVVSD
jgi:hypothetical protein